MKIAVTRRLLSLRDRQRRFVNFSMTLLLCLCAILALLPLLSVFIFVLKEGMPALNISFFTELPKPIGENGGGMSNAILGTGTLIALAALIGLPFGIAGGVYLSEYAHGKISQLLRFAIDLLTSVPSIIIGVFVYALLVKPLRHFSALAGAVALGIIMLPIVARTTEEILRLVPMSIREAGLALGIPRWKVVIFVVLRGSVPGISTGVILAIARAAGETAPLLFTSFGSQYWSHGVLEPIASLPVQIYTYAISPYENWHHQAWAGALVLVLFVLLLNILTRIVAQRSSD